MSRELGREPARLLRLLAGCKSAVVLSGYQSNLYDEVLPDGHAGGGLVSFLLEGHGQVSGAYSCRTD